MTIQTTLTTSEYQELYKAILMGARNRPKFYRNHPIAVLAAISLLYLAFGIFAGIQEFSLQLSMFYNPQKFNLAGIYFYSIAKTAFFTIFIIYLFSLLHLLWKLASLKKAVAQTTNITLDKIGLRSTREDASSDYFIIWQRISKVINSKNLYVLCVDTGVNIVIPKKDILSQQNTFDIYIKSHLPNIKVISVLQ